MSRCPECHSKISDCATICPHCGFRSKNEITPIKDLAIIAKPTILAIPESTIMQDGLLLLSSETNNQIVSFLTDAENAARLFPAIYDAIIKMMERGETKYTADFTKTAEDLMKRGELILMPDKAGRIMPQLRHSDNKQVYEMVRLKLEDFPADITPSITSMQMQFTMAEILSEIKSVAANVEALRMEIHTDRIAEANSVWMKLQQAVHIEDSRLREAFLLNIANSATDSRSRLQSNLVIRLSQLSEGSTKTKSSNANAALSDLTSMALMARSEYAAYTLLDEPETAQECLKQFSGFLIENKLHKRDKLLSINSQAGTKRPEIVEGFHSIANNMLNAFEKFGSEESRLLDHDTRPLLEDSNEEEVIDGSKE